MPEKKVTKIISKEVLNGFKGKINKDPQAIKDLIEMLDNDNTVLADDLKNDIIRENQEKMVKAIEKLPDSQKKLYKMLSEQKPIKVKVKINKENNTREIIF